MKRIVSLVLVFLVVFPMTVFAACGCNCGCYYCSYNDNDFILLTTLVVAGNDWNYDVKANVRCEPDIDSDIIAVIQGGTTIDVFGLYYSYKDGRIWAEIWHNGEYGYVSMKYLNALPEGSFFYLPTDTEVSKYTGYTSSIMAEFSGDQLISVAEIVLDSKSNTYWAKVLADGKFGYIPMEALLPVW